MRFGNLLQTFDQELLLDLIRDRRPKLFFDEFLGNMPFAETGNGFAVDDLLDCLRVVAINVGTRHDHSHVFSARPHVFDLNIQIEFRSGFCGSVCCGSGFFGTHTSFL